MTAIHNIRTFERDEITDEITVRALNLRTPLFPGDTLPAGIIVDLINEDEARSPSPADPLRYRTHQFMQDGTLVILCTFDDERPVKCIVTCHLTDAPSASRWAGAIHAADLAL